MTGIPRPSLPLPVLLIWMVASACKGGAQEVQLTIVPPLQASVGQEMGVPLHAYADGQPIEWGWRSLTNPMLSTRKQRPTLTTYTGGTAVWRWTPTAEDFGDQQIEFSASAGEVKSSQALSFSIGAGGTPPVFREPVGEGTTLDLRPMAVPDLRGQGVDLGGQPDGGAMDSATCARILVTVESTVSTMVELGLLTPVQNAVLMQSADLSGELSFCPSPQQIQGDTVYPVTLTASTGPYVVSKVYVIVLRRAS